MHVPEFLDALLRGPHVEVIEAGLPEGQAWEFLKQTLLARIAAFLSRQQSMRGALL